MPTFLVDVSGALCDDVVFMIYLHFFLAIFVLLYILCVVNVATICVTGFDDSTPYVQIPFSLLSCLLPHFASSDCTNVRRDKRACKLCHRPHQEENLMVDVQMQGTGDSLKALELQTSRSNSMRGKLY